MPHCSIRPEFSSKPWLWLKYAWSPEFRSHIYETRQVNNQRNGGKERVSTTSKLLKIAVITRFGFIKPYFWRSKTRFVKRTEGHTKNWFWIMSVLSVLRLMGITLNVPIHFLIRYVSNSICVDNQQSFLQFCCSNCTSHCSYYYEMFYLRF